MATTGPAPTDPRVKIASVENRHESASVRRDGSIKNAVSYTHLDVYKRQPLVCPCSTMFRIDAPHLAWILEGLVEGEVRNRITVDRDTARCARVALERMLAIT